MAAFSGRQLLLARPEEAHTFRGTQPLRSLVYPWKRCVKELKAGLRSQSWSLCLERRVLPGVMKIRLLRQDPAQLGRIHKPMTNSTESGREGMKAEAPRWDGHVRGTNWRDAAAS